jgi:hypothetical protein
VAVDNLPESFGQRMRERMPAHNLWRGPTSAPTLSRNAHDALWDEMRARLRSFDQQRVPAHKPPGWAPSDLIAKAASARSAAAVVVTGLLLLAALVELLR